MKKIVSIILSLSLLLTTMTNFTKSIALTTNTDFITSMTDIDVILKRPYDGAVPSGFSELIYAAHSTGYGFDKNTISMTGQSVTFDMPVDVTLGDKKLAVGEGIYRPSYVESNYDASKYLSQYTNIAPLGTVSATYEYTAAVVKNYASCMIDGVIDYDNSNPNRWATWNSPNNADTVTFDLVHSATVDKINLHFYTDGAGTLFPSDVTIKYLDNGEWKSVTGITYPQIVKGGATEYKFDAVTTNKIAITLTRAASNKGMAITEAEIYGRYEAGAFEELNVKVNEKKVVTANNIAASIITVINNGTTEKTVTVSSKNSRATLSEKQLGKYITMTGDGFDTNKNTISKTVTLKANETAEFILALSFADSEEESLSQAAAFFANSNRLETHKTEYFEWFKQNVPFFVCSDESITQTYWFRWLTYRNNIRLLSTDKYMISEFVPNVGWAGAHNSITAPIHHHIAEGRWLKDSKYISDYKDFFFENDGVKYTYYIAPFATAYYSDYLVNGDKDELTSHLDDLISVYNMWENKSKGDTEGYFDRDSGLWYVGNGHDAMEYSLSYHIAGKESGTKISINAYMYSEAVAIAKIAELAGKTNIAEQYRQKARTIKEAVENKMWNKTDSFFETYIPSENGTIDALELTGYLPWYTGLATDNDEYAQAWKYLADPDTFYGEYGPSTADKSHPLYNAYYTDTSLGRNGSCNWDGASWPFASTLTLVAAANALNDYTNNQTLTVEDYYKTLKAYTNGMYKDGYAWVGENLDSDTGKWYIDHASRSWHYNHSSYADLIITGLVGLRPDENADKIVINPLVPENTLTHFVLENVNYRGNDITVVYDADGSHYGIGTGVNVYVNGKKTAVSDTLEKLTISYCDYNEHDLKTVPQKQADCLNDGYSEHIACSKCDYIDGCEIYKTNGHSFQKQNGKKETCTTDGYKDYYLCTACNKYFADDKTTEISDVNTWKTVDGKVVSQGHQWGETILNNDASKFKNASTSKICHKCDMVEHTIAEGTKVPVEMKDTSKIFKDVKAGKWYTKALDYCYSYGFVAGVSKTEFGRDTNVTRGMFITILSRIYIEMYGDDVNIPRDRKFIDVEPDKYYTNAIAWAHERGIVSGTSKTTFSPDAPITRQDLCVMIRNFTGTTYVKLSEKESEVAFKDASKISTYAKKAVKDCQTAGLVSGYEDGTFRPKDNATRAEATQILYMLCKNFIEAKYK